MKKIYVRINSFDYRGSICDGPGIRSIVFFQGCRVHCEGCHNPSTWDETGGSFVLVSDLAKQIVNNSPTKRVTISGGEPMLQLDGLIELVKELRNEQFDICLYTSYEKHDIPMELLQMLDYIKTGPYISKLHTSDMPYIGSTNQKFEKVRLD